ncbi:probable LRR receptor-like serine/threonine-protein kinase At3g47570 [Salvia splendens]|uniref:probable LRR receptor-like serine/threonine-protein kinase At3g47570 n=1 Tax=Salvia splendens TaxID=180675 RepID=UPI001C278CDC|nr:probable LRR receptor-like serine/threonine-protein kinase At3g47570 [Salvia splendens]
MDYSSAKSDINPDRSSLIAFKSRISSDPNNILSQNWRNESNICSWMGVTCDSRYHRVTQLNISSMGLVGTIPPEIGNLSFLVSLDLSENSFHGPIPSSIFNMSSLEVLNLRNNSLSSSLPIDMCKHNLHGLKRLRISYNKLFGEIPSSLEHCSQLTYVSLATNNFSGHVPTQIGNLTLLQELYLGSNNLSG